MLSESLISSLEAIVKQVADTWPMDHNGVCKFCGFSKRIPGPKVGPYEAAEILLDVKSHFPSCSWSSSREIIRLLG